MNKNAEQVANEIIQELKEAGLSYESMIKIIRMARIKLQYKRFIDSEKN